MATEVKEKQTGISYLDPLPKQTTNKGELQAFRYCVIDGECFTDRLEPAVLPDGRYGFLVKSICVGPVEKVKQKIQERENGDVTPSANSGETQRPGVEDPVTKLKPSNDTPKSISEANKNNFVTAGRPKKSLPEKEIRAMHNKGMTTREIASKYKVSHMTIARILNGQRVLV